MPEPVKVLVLLRSEVTCSHFLEYSLLSLEVKSTLKISADIIYQLTLKIYSIVSQNHTRSLRIKHKMKTQHLNHKNSNVRSHGETSFQVLQIPDVSVLVSCQVSLWPRESNGLSGFVVQAQTTINSLKSVYYRGREILTCSRCIPRILNSIVKLLLSIPYF